jgi:AraC family transcriptional regulator
MKPVAETIAALGTPVFMHTVGEGSSPSAVIARWRHRGAEIDIAASDTVRVAISLQNGQHVREQRGNAASRANITAGSVSVLPAHERTKIAIQGEADILQIFLRETFLEAAVEGQFCCLALFNSHDSELQAAAMQLFVAATRGDPDDSLLLESGVHRMAARLLGHGDHQPPAPTHGGLA